MLAQMHQVRHRQPPLLLQPVLNGHAWKGFHDEGGIRTTPQFVRADDVGMAQAQEKTSFPEETPAPFRLPTAVRPQHLGGAATVAINAPDLVDVEQAASAAEP